MIREFADTLKSIIESIQAEPALLSKLDPETIRVANSLIEKADPELVWCYLDISTGHLSIADQEVLEGCNGAPFYSQPHNHGCEFRVPTNEDMGEHQVALKQFSPEFIALLAYARDRGCAYINLDADAATTADLLYFE